MTIHQSWHGYEQTGKQPMILFISTTSGPTYTQEPNALSHVFLGNRMDLLNISWNCRVWWDLDLAIEHLEHPSERFVFNDLEWLVALANPESDQKAKFASTVGGPMRKCTDRLVIRSLLPLAAVNMADEVGCRIICTRTGAGWWWMSGTYI